jgi:hypothetical protein
VGIGRSFALLGWLATCTAVPLGGSFAAAQGPPCRRSCAERQVFDERTGCCIEAPDLAEAERVARAAEASAVAAARAELEAGAARERAAFESQDDRYRTLFVAATVSFLTNFARMDHPTFVGDVARSSLFRLGGIAELAAPVLRRQGDRRPLVSVEASIAAEAPVSYIGSFMFLPGLRGELRLRAFYVAPLVYSEIQWFRVRLDALTTGDAGPREQGRASSAGFGLSVGDYGTVEGLGWLLDVRFGPLIDGGDANVSGELRVMEGKQVYELYFHGFDRLGDFTHGFSVGLALGMSL